MSAAGLARHAANAYPRSWRVRYGAELEDVIESLAANGRVSWVTVLDVAAGAVRERVRELWHGPAGDSPDRLRAAMVTVLWAWALFVVGGIGVQKVSEHWRGGLHGSYAAASDAFAIFIAGAAVASLAVIGGAVIALPALREFVRGGGWPRVRRHVVRAAVMTGLLAGVTLLVIAAATRLDPHQRNGHDVAFEALVLGWALAGCVALAAWTRVATLVVRELDLGGRVLRIEGLLTIGAAVVMAIVAAAAVVWWIALDPGTRAVLAGSASVAAYQFAIPACLMLVATALALAGGRRAARALAHPPA